MSTFPILVERFDASNVAVMGCNACGRTHDYRTPEAFMEAEASANCRHCGAFSDYLPAYMPGEKCKGCGEIAQQQPVDGCCSRACMLQAEYAATLVPSLREGNDEQGGR